MIRVHIWGSRGSVASPGAATAKYGGNTACVQVIGYDDPSPGAAARRDTPQVILDAGTGLALLKSVLMSGPLGRGEGQAHLCLSHFHWDHLIGLPFFSPIFLKGNRLHFYGQNEEKVRKSIERLFTSVYSPIKGTENLAASLEYHDLPTKPTDIGGFAVSSAPTTHPGGGLAMRIQYGNRTVVYATDHEIGNTDIDEGLVDLAKGADLWILDAQFDHDEITAKKRWGHSSHIQAVQLALQARVRKVLLFHHDPDHDDRTLDRMGLEAQSEAQGSGTEVIIARDGMILNL